nr:YbhN family protein [Entomohabitans teleogrylli]
MSSRSRWRRLRKILSGLFLLAVAVLLVVYAQKIDWPEVWKVMRDGDPYRLLAAAGLVVVSYLIYGGYELLARQWCHHRLAAGRVMLIAFVCYAFNLTLSTWVGGIGMRYRLYSRPGLRGATIAHIFTMSIATNWLGYILLGGALFTSGLLRLPAHWYIGPGTLRLFGVILLAIVALYLWACARAKKRHIRIRGNTFSLPSWRFALAQLALSSVNWMAMAATVWLLMGSNIDYVLVLGILLVSSIAGVIVHIPAGIGVTEAVFVALLAGEPVSRNAIIAALLVWRVLYFFIPLLLATFAWLGLESQAKRLQASSPGSGEEKPSSAAVAKNAQQHQEQVDKVQIQG